MRVHCGDTVTARWGLFVDYLLVNQFIFSYLKCQKIVKNCLFCPTKGPNSKYIQFKMILNVAKQQRFEKLKQQNVNSFNHLSVIRTAD